ncbi:hypothetical protein GGX14DRAFT_399803 [Mycena pura]|uniref:Hydrophobin n=1 Tax=Mycena pura TaxID=153505 RepID=A0AAD6Y6I2_9AGAR|nr:hypothetical protein GGX14DRAFT_399803 [Mycena pura]
MRFAIQAQLVVLALTLALGVAGQEVCGNVQCSSSQCCAPNAAQTDGKWAICTCGLWQIFLRCPASPGSPTSLFRPLNTGVALIATSSSFLLRVPDQVHFASTTANVSRMTAVIHEKLLDELPGVIMMVTCLNSVQKGKAIIQKLNFASFMVISRGPRLAGRVTATASAARQELSFELNPALSSTWFDGVECKFGIESI